MNKNIIRAIAIGIAGSGISSCAPEKALEKMEVQQPNFLLITADDMNYSAVGAFGCPVTGTTPNLDRLAKEGIRFTNAHVAHAVCQPSRGAIMTGMYGHVSGIEGFTHYKGDKLTLTEYLKKYQLFNRHDGEGEPFCAQV
jgi:membrane-anchored protein YejM (alkaline phosphatase superfamily)